MLGAKRRRTNDIRPLSNEVVMAARGSKLDLAKTVPPNISQWIEVLAKSRDTTPEFVLLSAFPAAATLMGPSSVVKVRATYTEPINLFGLVLALPGAGKSQAFELTVTSPFNMLDNPPPKIVVGDHTRSGLARHLVDNDGMALIASDELCAFLDNFSLKKRDSQDERAFLNKVYDRKHGTGTYTYEYGNSRLEIDESRVCISGFSEDEEFVHQFVDLCARKDGFVDRILFAVPEPRLLKNSEVDEWTGKLNNFRVSDLCEVYQEIWEYHHTRAKAAMIYTLSDDAKKEYELYSDELIRQLNSKFSGTAKDDVDASSKDCRTVLRLAGVLHVLYTVIERALTNPNFRQEEEELPMAISITTMKYAVALTEYYKEQRSIFVEAAKGNTNNTLSLTALKSKIVLHPGPCVTVRNLTRSLPCSTRPDAKRVCEAMKALEEEHMGVVVQAPNNTVVFLKVKSTDLQNDEQAMKALESLATFELYCHKFSIRDNALKDQYFKQLLRLHPNQEELCQFFGLS